MTIAAVRDAAVDADLAAREAIIERGLQSFLDVGLQLTVIRAQRLYYQDFETFEAYCQSKWGLTRTRAYALLGSAELVAGMSQIRDTEGIVLNPPLPANQGQAEALTGLDPEVAAKVMAKAHEDAPAGKKVTAEDISEAREQVAPKPPVAKPEPTPEPPKADPPPRPRRQQPVLEGEALAKYDAEKSCEDLGFVLGLLEALAVPEHRARVLEFWKTGSLGATPHNRELHTPATIRRLAEALATYADELERTTDA